MILQALEKVVAHSVMEGMTIQAVPKFAFQ